MYEIVLDTETTGLSAADGDRVIEVGCLELFNHTPTGKSYHTYINPQRAISAGAVAVHNLTEERLANEPLFADIVEDFLTFIGEATLVIHNADFDLSMLNAELARLKRPALANPHVDTLMMARRKFPGAPASLDALCQRFRVDRGNRDEGHGALLDVQLLTKVYIHLLGGLQNNFTFGSQAAPLAITAVNAPDRRNPPRMIEPTKAERAGHEALLDAMTNPLWRHDGALDHAPGDENPGDQVPGDEDS